MKALCWCGKESVKVEQVPDAKILNPRDALVRITTTCLCGSDLHLYGGFMPGLMPGDILVRGGVGRVVAAQVRRAIQSAGAAAGGVHLHGEADRVGGRVGVRVRVIRLFLPS